MAELADAIDLGSIVNRRAGSSPVIRMMKGSLRVNELINPEASFLFLAD